MEGAVDERDVAGVDARLEAVCLEYPQRGVAGVAVASGTQRRFAEFLAQLVSPLVQRRPR